jgi:WD40 repeat protein
MQPSFLNEPSLVSNESELHKKSKQRKPSRARPPVPLLNIHQIFGISSKSHSSIKINPVTGEIAYPAGSVIVLYNIQLNKQTKYINSPNRRPVSCLNFSPNGKYIVFGEVVCKTSEIFIYDLLSDQIIYQLRGHKFGISNVLYSPNGRYLISIGGENDKGLFVWDVTKNYTKLTLNKLSKKIHASEFNSTGSLFITAGVSHLKFWNFDTLGNIIMVKVNKNIK